MSFYEEELKKMLAESRRNIRAVLFLMAFLCGTMAGALIYVIVWG